VISNPPFDPEPLFVKVIVIGYVEFGVTVDGNPVI
jgi:hypothetical protein